VRGSEANEWQIQVGPPGGRRLGRGRRHGFESGKERGASAPGVNEQPAEDHWGRLLSSFDSEREAGLLRRIMRNTSPRPYNLIGNLRGESWPGHHICPDGAVDW